MDAKKYYALINLFALPMYQIAGVIFYAQDSAEKMRNGIATVAPSGEVLA
ncbi:MAG TPA: hypothetical protein VG737_05995 [Cyclobacteriaceae bacterium]|nr:hypothetical protein [Cyclobacteriaceae bacterium]